MPKPQAGATEVVAKPENDRRQRRRFSPAEKERILNEADRCERGQLGELLRREGIYSSLLNHWRVQRKKRGAEGLENRKPGPVSTKDERDRVIEAQNRRIAALEREAMMASPSSPRGRSFVEKSARWPLSGSKLSMPPLPLTQSAS
jgi:transposase-like protein